MIKLTPRQVHLDFHTSPLIDGIGSNFSKENFQEALKLGHLSSITVFAKCHHSQCYYPTKVGTMHPHLKFDLLGAEIDAAHEIGVKAPIYITAGWSAEDAKMHPEWLARNKDGSPSTRRFDESAGDNDPIPNCCWLDLCLNDGSYCNHIYDLTREICDRYDNIDGLFYDICIHQEACYCDECVRGMKELGLDPENEEDAKKYLVMKRQDWMRKCREILYEKHPGTSIFFNSGGADPYRPQFHCGSTHFELEDLPTAWGGYDKMPPTAKYFANSGKDYMGMTGKFHTEWGEFGGFKTGDALKFEISAMLTYGARCSVGDQMHPDGMMDLDTYRNIGVAYEYAEKIEEYCLDGVQTTKLGLYLSGNEDSDAGAEKLLLETQNDFDIVYMDNFAPFEVVLFPDCVKLSAEAAKKLREYISGGGKVIFTGESLIEDGNFLPDIGADYVGQSEFLQDYLCVNQGVSPGMVTSPMLMYSSATVIKNRDAEVLSGVLYPYFDRTYGHYCSHRNTPYDRTNQPMPAAVKKGGIVYIAHKICKMYRDFGSVYHKRYFRNCLSLIYGETDKVLDVKMDYSAGRVSMIKQANKKRFCLNLLYASPIKRNIIEVIEDLPPIYNIPVSIKTEERVVRVWSPVDGNDLPFELSCDGVFFTVPEIQCHRLIVIEYA